MANTRGALGLMAAMVVTAHADPPPPMFDDAVRTAAEANKPLVLEFSASWCGPCREFEKEVLPDPEVQAALGNVLFVRYDAEVGPGLEAAAKLRVDSYPTFLVIDKRGVDTKRQLGALDVHDFVEFLSSAKQSVVDEAEIRADLVAHPADPAVRLRAARWYATHHMVAAALPYYGAVAKHANATQKDRDEASAALDHLQRLETWRHDLVADKVGLIRAAPATVKLDDLAIALVDSTLERRDVRVLAATVLAASTDVARTNSIIYIALAAGAKDEALAAARKLVAASRQAQFLDTLAECLHVVGDRAQALQTEDEAAKLVSGPTSLASVLKRNRARFDTGQGDANEVTQLHFRVGDLWKRLETSDQLADRVVLADDSAELRARMTERRKAWEAEAALAEKIAVSCRQEAGKSELAVARIELDVEGHIKSSSVLVEESAKAKLRACITRQLQAATLPASNDRLNRQLRIDLQPRRAP
jgi:thiol-disulfide isomerase/thioredoxin